MANAESDILAMLKDKHPEFDYESSGDYIADGLLDSFDIVLLTTELESRFGVSIPGEAILPENFASAAAIAAFVQHLQAAA